MNIRTICGVLILGGSLAMIAPATTSLAQPGDKPAAEAKDAAAPNTNMNPTKHRYWRHRGGRHPHFGSRRIRT